MVSKTRINDSGEVLVTTLINYISFQMVRSCAHEVSYFTAFWGASVVEDSDAPGADLCVCYARKYSQYPIWMSNVYSHVT